VKIGLISDTHGWIHPSLYKYFSECDEIWHAGDIGGVDVVDKLTAFKPLRAVYGNIDDYTIRRLFNETLRFNIEGVEVLITHIGGFPGRYSKGIAAIIKKNPPDLFICGHSHIARVQYDKPNSLLHINPGAAGYHGFHHIMTAARFVISESKVTDLELIEMGERGRTPVMD
jgi:hypothetical protein